MAWTTIFVTGALRVQAGDRDHPDPKLGRVQTLTIIDKRGDEIMLHEISPDRIVALGRAITAEGERLIDERATANLEAAHAQHEQQMRTLAELDAQFAGIQLPKEPDTIAEQVALNAGKCLAWNCENAAGASGYCAEHDEHAEPVVFEQPRAVLIDETGGGD